MIKEFTDLIAWKECHELVLEIYRIVNQFPKKEQFGLSSQMERAGISITSNIAEGFGRFTYKEKARFYSISSGSVSEIKNQLILAKDLHYISTEEFQNINLKANKCHKLVRGLIRSTLALGKNSVQSDI